MGYFSDLAITYVRCDHDCSYSDPEKQLLCRYDALNERLWELLLTESGDRDDGLCFSEESLSYALPRHFLSVSDVRKAIDLTIRDLAERYDIHIRKEPAEEPPELDEITEMQVSFWDIFALQACYAQLHTA